MIFTALTNISCFFRAGYSTSCTQRDSNVYATCSIVSCSACVVYCVILII